MKLSILSPYRAFAVRLAPIFRSQFALVGPWKSNHIYFNVEKNIIRAKVRNFTFNLGQIGSNASLDMS